MFSKKWRENDSILMYGSERDQGSAKRINPERQQATPYTKQSGELSRPGLHRDFFDGTCCIDVGGAVDTVNWLTGVGGNNPLADRR